MCVAGARWVQDDLLAKSPSSRLRVYAVWFNMIGSDQRSKWPADLLTDPRVLHFWDEKRVVGSWFGRHPDYMGSDSVLWDAYLLYGPEAYWAEAPSHRVGWGRTIVGTRRQLEKELLGLLSAGSQAPVPPK